MSSAVAGVEHCHICFKFMSRADVLSGITWTPYGGYYDFEPPEPEFAHHHCWGNIGDRRQREIICISWVKPMLVRKIGHCDESVA